MTTIARPVLRGVAPAEIIADDNLDSFPTGSAIRKSATVADGFEYFSAVDQAALPSNGIDTVVYVDGSVPGGNTIANQIGPTAFASTYTIPANFLTANSLIRVRASGVYGSAAIATTLRIQLQLGGTSLLAQSATLTPASLTNAGWALEGDLIATVVGAGGTFEAQGKLTLGNVNAGATLGPKGADIYMLTNTAGIAKATNANLAITIIVTWGAANANDTITLRIMTVDIIRP